MQLWETSLVFLLLVARESLLFPKLAGSVLWLHAPKSEASLSDALGTLAAGPVL